MKNKVLLITFWALLTSVVTVAQGKPPEKQKSGAHIYGVDNCAAANQLLQDGSTIAYPDSIVPNDTNYYGESFLAGHSYSVDVWDPYDPYNGSTPSLSLLYNCALGPIYTDVKLIDPVLNKSFSDRISWISTTSDYYEVGLHNPDGSRGYAYFIRVTDTTLHNPRWSTYSGFVTQYSFVNTTNADISGVLTVIDGASGTQYPLNITIPKHSQVLQLVPSAGIPVPKDHAGFADFAFVGPSGGIMADAYFLNSSATVIVPSSFGPRNYQH